MAYIVQADLENRISAAVLREILDDDASGSPDAGPLAQVIADAEAFVESWLFPVYDGATIRAQGVNVNAEIKRLCLDVAVAYLWERHPEYIRADGRALLARARQDLHELREGKRQLATLLAPEPAANQGGITRTGDAEDPTPPEDKMFLDPNSFGIYS